MRRFASLLMRMLVLLGLLAGVGTPAAAYPARAWNSILPPLLPADARQRIEAERTYLLAHKTYLERRLAEVQPLIRQIAREVDRRNLPSILILLPFIESGYRLDVVSTAGAAGLWQLMPQTAQRYGVPFSQGFDGRHSLPLSTEAALTYLSWLHEQFEGDWLLALAAYNAGEGRIQQKQLESGERSYWRLPLVEETRRYVPRLLALAELLQQPQRYGLVLPTWGSGEELTIRRYPAPLSLSALARAANWSEPRLAALNPALRQGILYAPGEYLLLVPASKAEQMQEASGRLGLEMSSIAPLVSLDSLADPLIVHSSQGLDLQGRQTPATSGRSGDPLQLQQSRKPLGHLLN